MYDEKRSSHQEWERQPQEAKDRQTMRYMKFGLTGAKWSGSETQGWLTCHPQIPGHVKGMVKGHMKGSKGKGWNAYEAYCNKGKGYSQGSKGDQGNYTKGDNNKGSKSAIGP